MPTVATIRADILSTIRTHGPLLFSELVKRYKIIDRGTLRTLLRGLIADGRAVARDDGSGVNLYEVIHEATNDKGAR